MKEKYVLTVCNCVEIANGAQVDLEPVLCRIVLVALRAIERQTEEKVKLWDVY